MADDHDPIKSESPVPRYRQLAEILREHIESGQITGRLPSEKTLIQEYGLAQGTVRKAVALLRSEGLVETTHGLGTFIVPLERRRKRPPPGSETPRQPGD